MTWRRFAPRRQKALKIQNLFSEFLGEREARELQCLDIGCGNGEIARHLTGYFGNIVALDNVFQLVREAYEKRPVAPMSLLQAEGIRLPFTSTAFDVVICAQVYEHMANARQLPIEVERVLKPGGLCFFSGPNKMWPIEPHYRLPFLHWLPAKLAGLYMRASGRGAQFDIRPLTYWHLRRLWERFTIYDCTMSVLHEPDRFGLPLSMSRLFRSMPSFLLKMFYFLIPNYNWVLVKPDEKENPH